MKSAELIGWALGGLEREIAQTRERLTALTTHAAKLREQLGAQISRGASALSSGLATEEAPESRGLRRRKMSAEARKRISEMMRKRWAERKKRGLKRL